MTERQKPAAARELPKLVPLTARTLVDQAVDAIVQATATGVFLPGDRIVEAELARSLNISRVPVREALRLLESQGIVVNERYRGMRLMDVNADRLERTLKVRLALENLAGAEIIARLGVEPGLLAPLAEALARMRAAGEAGDGYRVAQLDTEFHHCLCQLSGNDVLVRTWEPLSRQLTILFGLSTLRKDLHDIVAEHDEVLALLRRRDIGDFERLMRVHILDYSRQVDYEGMVAQRRAAASGLTG